MSEAVPVSVYAGTCQPLHAQPVGQVEQGVAGVLALARSARSRVGMPVLRVAVAQQLERPER